MRFFQLTFYNLIIYSDQNLICSSLTVFWLLVMIITCFNFLYFVQRPKNIFTQTEPWFSLIRTETTCFHQTKDRGGFTLVILVWIKLKIRKSGPDDKV